MVNDKRNVVYTIFLLFFGKYTSQILWAHSGYVIID